MPNYRILTPTHSLMNKEKEAAKKNDNTLIICYNYLFA